ncbi:uncharacterized protein C8orf48 homolog [Otolemur garnettii]|uniref:uncharacterized protein C8orf48 homolog n=1 Tax=Otolemur garnettii TaxID=30611 RepID=UPI00064461A6|nr:uncharacterized protein C8orf48 homolog [Otolemur garnettii]
MAKSEDAKQEQGELAQTERSTLADLSDETGTFSFFTNEVQSSGSFSSSGGPQSWSCDPGNKPESEEQIESLEQDDKHSELSDFENNEKKFSIKWINYLKGKETNSEWSQPDTRLQTEISQVSDRELHALQSFCAIKINLIHHRVNSKKKSSRQKKPQLRLNRETSERDALNCTVPDELVNRIYFKNLRTAPIQVTEAKQHISSQCPECNKKRAELAQYTFLKEKKTLLESFLLREKIDEHLYAKDVLTRIGEAHRDLPGLSDDPRIIWKRLNEKDHIRYSGVKRSETEQKI